MATVDDLLKVAQRGAENQRKQRDAAQALSVAVGNQPPAAPQQGAPGGNSEATPR